MRGYLIVQFLPVQGFTKTEKEFTYGVIQTDVDGLDVGDKYMHWDGQNHCMSEIFRVIQGESYANQDKARAEMELLNSVKGIMTE